jgi:hypothetical protein
MRVRVAATSRYVQPRIEAFTRQPDGSWTLRIYGPGERAVLASVECTIEMDKIYEGVHDTGP